MPRLGEFTPDHTRFWSKVQTSDDCWIWTGCRDQCGYGMFSVRIGSHHRHKSVRAHRYAYELLIGPVPADKVLDHVECDNPSCVNPAHLLITTNAGNVLRSKVAFVAVNKRKTHCKRGHEFNSANTRTFENGLWRSCRACDGFHHKYARKAKAIWTAICAEGKK